jgi:hypothetical protein
MKTIRLATALACILPVALSAATATFDDLFSPPALTSTTGLTFTTAPGDGLSYAGVVWDSRVTVVGDQYKVDSGGPLFGLPHSGNYFITNESTDGGDGITLATTQVLTGAWFGRNEYYGFGGGADAITIIALAGATPLGSVSFNLPEVAAGQPEMLSFVDTSAFTGLVGITGYRIDRNAPEASATNWVADDFQFSPAAIPEPSTAAAAAGILALAFVASRRRAPR